MAPQPSQGLPQRRARRHYDWAYVRQKVAGSEMR
jgi:hypothetical protein